MVCRLMGEISKAVANHSILVIREFLVYAFRMM